MRQINYVFTFPFPLLMAICVVGQLGAAEEENVNSPGLPETPVVGQEATAEEQDEKKKEALPPSPGAADSLDREVTLPADDELIIEVVRERFPDGQIRSERQVARDVGFNFVNHGSFQMFDTAGCTRAAGDFRAGRREGKWTRSYWADDSPLFSTEPFKDFVEPFMSEATFKNGRLHGTWTMSDKEDRKVFEIQYSDGARDGKLVFYHPNGQLARHAEFVKGIIHATESRYDDDGNLVEENEYLHGRPWKMKTGTFVSTKKKSETYYIYPSVVMKSVDNWWVPKLAEYVAGEGAPLAHGPYRVWHINGQQRIDGAFEHGKPTGEYTFWHENGQVATKGTYKNGEQDGMWYWWHPNGIRQTEGRYENGQKRDRWIVWKADGNVGAITDHQPQTQNASQETPVSEPSDEESADNSRLTNRGSNES